MANLATAFLILLLAAPAAVYAVQYTVGDSTGWTQGYDYTTWVSGKTFTVGDVLVFNYGGNHGVDVVSQSDYDNCVTSNALKSYSDGNTKYTLSSPGTVYFICPTLGHCGGGMKLAVTVSGSPSSGGGGGNPPSTTPSGGSPPSGSGTPAAGTPPRSSGAASVFSISVYNLMVVFVSVLVVAFMC